MSTQRDESIGHVVAAIEPGVQARRLVRVVIGRLCTTTDGLPRRQQIACGKRSERHDATITSGTVQRRCRSAYDFGLAQKIGIDEERRLKAGRCRVVLAGAINQQGNRRSGNAPDGWNLAIDARPAAKLDVGELLQRSGHGCGLLVIEILLSDDAYRSGHFLHGVGGAGGCHDYYLFELRLVLHWHRFDFHRIGADELVTQPAAGQQLVQRLSRREAAFDVRRLFASEQFGRIHGLDAALLGKLGQRAGQGLRGDVDLHRLGGLCGGEAGDKQAGDQSAAGDVTKGG